MPTSNMMNVSPVMAEIWRIRPTRILDLGVGIGKMGMLCRELLDISEGRLYPKDWVINIVGVEGFKGYENPLHTYFYNGVLHEDFSAGLYRDFDCILMIDCLEHIPKDRGHALLDLLLQHNKYVIVSCPVGENYVEQGEVFGNPYEVHRARWEEDDFSLRRGRTLYKGVCIVSSIRGQGRGTDNLWIR